MIGDIENKIVNQIEYGNVDLVNIVQNTEFWSLESHQTTTKTPAWTAKYETWHS